MIEVDKVVVAHYSPLIERKKRFSQDLQKLNLECVWYQQEPNDVEKEKYYNPDHLSWYRKLSMIPEQQLIPFRILKRSEISLAYKHVRMYEDIVKSAADTCLVLEDDVVFSDDFVKQFNISLKNTPADWDMICIGSGCDLRISPDRLIPGQTAYRKAHPASKCTDSYVITRKAAEKIYQTIIPFNFPIDWELNYQLWHHDMKVYWWEPPLTRQGSQCGLYGSEIQ